MKETNEQGFWKELPKKVFLGGLLVMAGIVLGNWLGGPIDKAKAAAGF